MQVNIDNTNLLEALKGKKDPMEPAKAEVRPPKVEHRTREADAV